MTTAAEPSLSRLAGLGWNASVPPNGFANRRAVKTVIWADFSRPP
jgi:hypothetical protein